MSVTTVSSREFNQAASEVKRAASKGPVFITDRGRPAHVLMSIELYERLAGSPLKIADLLATQGLEDSSFSVARSRELARSADLS